MTPREQRIAQYILTVRGHLEEQCFWAYPPPLVDEDSRVVASSQLSGAEIIAQLLAGYKGDGSFNASYELYRRYKYGRMERKYFRDRARRLAAKEMVRFHLFMMQPVVSEEAIMKEENQRGGGW